MRKEPRKESNNEVNERNEGRKKEGNKKHRDIGDKKDKKV